VIDTQVLLRATLNPRSLPAKIIFELGHLYILALSPGIRAEVEDVLNRPKLRSKFPGLTNETVARTLALLDDAQQVVPESVPNVSRDPKDDIFLATAIASAASYLISEDNDLLVLHPYQGIQIVNALAFLKSIQPPVVPDDIS
jgi:uncharacterized protein